MKLEEDVLNPIFVLGLGLYLAALRCFKRVPVLSKRCEIASSAFFPSPG
jgi:hypothetical protein